jgi:hypothetical protein
MAFDRFTILAKPNDFPIMSRSTGPAESGEAMRQIISPFKKRLMLSHSLIMALVWLVSLGCVKPSDEIPRGGHLDRGEKAPPIQNSPRSANGLLYGGDIHKFQPGRSIDTVLKDVQWRGDFQAATTYKGKSVCSVMYMLLPDGATNNDRGEWVLAVFVDDKFTKFVTPPPPLPDDLKKRYDRMYERDMPYCKPIKVGDCKFLIRALESGPVNIVDLHKKLNSEPAAPSHVDPGLTAVFLAFKPALSVRWDRESKKNAALRDQFNASRLRIGMTGREVESVLRTEPLESGKVEARSYRIYGSNESFDIALPLHFTNVLVVFDKGKVSVVHSVAAGFEWRQRLAQRFIDLPAPPRR